MNSCTDRQKSDAGDCLIAASSRYVEVAKISFVTAKLCNTCQQLREFKRTIKPLHYRYFLLLIMQLHLSQFDMESLQLDAYGAIIRVGDKQVQMMIGNYILIKVLVC